MEGLAKSAIQILEKKHLPPRTPSPQAFIPEEQYRQLFDMLEVWDKDAVDDDVQTKAKFIYDILGENPKDGLMTVITEMGLTPPNEKRVDRVYKYLRLKNQANKILNQYETLQREINGFRTR